MLGKSITLEQKIALVSAAAAVGSVLLTWVSVRVSRHALKLARADHEEKRRHFTAHLIDGLSYTQAPGERLVAFSCSISNAASESLAIVRADLHVYAFDPAGTVSEVILLPAPATTTPFPGLSPLAVPLNLLPRAAASGWLTYLVPEHLFRSRTIDRYELVLRSSTGEQATLIQYLLRSVDDADRKS